VQHEFGQRGVPVAAEAPLRKHQRSRYTGHYHHIAKASLAIRYSAE